MMSVTIAASARRERCPELRVQLTRALDDVRLVDGDDPAARHRASCRERHLELGRVVTVVVVHGDATSRADELESPVDAGEPRDRSLGLPARHSRELERGECGGRVLAIVLAGDRELEGHRLELPAANDVRDTGEPLIEERREVGLRRVGRVVVELDVGDDGDLRRQGADRPVGFVALDDEPPADRYRRSRRAAGRGRR